MRLWTTQDSCMEGKPEQWSPVGRGKDDTGDYDGHKEKHALLLTM